MKMKSKLILVIFLLCMLIVTFTVCAGCTGNNQEDFKSSEYIVGVWTEPHNATYWYLEYRIYSDNTCKRIGYQRSASTDWVATKTVSGVWSGPNKQPNDSNEYYSIKYDDGNTDNLVVHSNEKNNNIVHLIMGSDDYPLYRTYLPYN